MIKTLTEYNKIKKELRDYEDSLYNSMSWQELAESGFKFLAIRKYRELNKLGLIECKEIIESYLED